MADTDPDRGDYLSRPIFQPKPAPKDDPIVGHKTLRHDDGTLYHEPLRASEAAMYRERAEEADRKRKELMPDEQTAIRIFFDAWLRLKELGWKEAMYCPKDGSTFEVIEAGSTGIFKCHYEGEWPTGSYWLEDAHDSWPSRPTLFRLLEKKP